MNRFRKLGFIHYNGGLEVHSSLLNIVLHDSPNEGGGSNKARAAKVTFDTVIRRASVFEPAKETPVLGGWLGRIWELVRTRW